MKKQTKVGMVVGVVCCLAAAVVAWTGPSGTEHANSSTCNTEKCARHCRGCCLHFHPTNTSTEFLNCNNTCATLGSQCNDPDETPYPVED